MIHGLLDMLGDIDLETCGEDDRLEAQDYLLFLLEATKAEGDEYEPEVLREALLDYGYAAAWFAPEVLDPASLPVPDLRPEGDYWIVVKDGDARARQLFERHYSADVEGRRRRGATQFVGPGEKLVLMTPRADALFAWRLSYYRQDEQWGAECTIFRNEGPYLSSEMILRAEAFSSRRWPHLARFITYVDAAATAGRRSRHSLPGACFRHAGWQEAGESKKGLILLEKLHIPDVYYLPWFENGEGNAIPED